MMRKLAAVAIVILLTACNGSGGPATTSSLPSDAGSSTSTVSVASTTVPVDTSSSTTTTIDAWDGVPNWRGGAAGEYRTANFAVPLRFTTTSAWTGSDQIDNVSIVKSDGSGIWFHEMGFGTIEEALQHFQAMENVEFTEPANVTIGGANGVSMDGTVTANQSIRRLADGYTLQWPAGSETKLHVLDVGGDIVVIDVDTGGSGPNYMEGIAAILDSVLWRALEG